MKLELKSVPAQAGTQVLNRRSKFDILSVPAKAGTYRLSSETRLEILSVLAKAGTSFRLPNEVRLGNLSVPALIVIRINSGGNLSFIE